MTQTSDILDALRKAGIPLNTDQIAEQVPHVPRANISALCSQLRKREILIGGLEEGRLSFTIAPGALASKLQDIDLDREAVESLPANIETDDEKPPTQSFNPSGIDMHAVVSTGVESESPYLAVDDNIATVGNPSAASDGSPIGETPVRFSDSLGRPAAAMEVFVQLPERLAKPPEFSGPDLAQHSADAFAYGPLAAKRKQDSANNRLTRELAAAIVQRWPGQIPYDVLRLIERAAALPL